MSDTQNDPNKLFLLHVCHSFFSFVFIEEVLFFDIHSDSDTLLNVMKWCYALWETVRRLNQCILRLLFKSV